eukprot:6211432-Pleurochrysis_carterae.AAC.1
MSRANANEDCRRKRPACAPIVGPCLSRGSDGLKGSRPVQKGTALTTMRYITTDRDTAAFHSGMNRD